LHKLSPKDAVLREANHKWFLVVQVEIKKGRKTVTIRSPLQVAKRIITASPNRRHNTNTSVTDTGLNWSRRNKLRKSSTSVNGPSVIIPSIH